MTGRFLSPLQLEYAIDGSGQKEHVAPLRYQSALAAVRKAFPPDGIIEVPSGTRTDLASVPRLPVLFLLFGATADAAAAVHDHLYTTGAVSRALADEVFAEAMAACGEPPWRRGPMWLGVRLFGGSRYTAPPAKAV